MTPAESLSTPGPRGLKDGVRVRKILNSKSLAFYGGITPDRPGLAMLAAGKGTRFGQEPKCIQAVHGTPLARHSFHAAFAA